ncbi:MAG: Holliday junction resolvase RuvX [Burkholderiales bacterium]
MPATRESSAQQDFGIFPTPALIIPSQGSVLAFDYGLKRIGVAVGDRATGIAHPLLTIHAQGGEQRFAAIAPLLREWQPVLLVLGLPLRMDGAAHPHGSRCRRFARRLAARSGIPAVLVDERLTSATARIDLHASGVCGRRQKPMIDQIAALHILQALFDGAHYETA